MTPKLNFLTSHPLKNGTAHLPPKEEAPQSRRCRHPNTGLGRTNILNMVDAIAPVEHAKGVRSHQAESSLKRDSGIQDVVDERPLKKQRLAFRDEDDMRWVQHEITGVKESLEKIAAEAREDRQDINRTLQELLHEIQQRR
ncbi:hypothetical protein BDZ97DRAFT_1921379 [Flammula alnicola]|nr:hypothetical protein BDZ97DRAFT_1921379 [Flammula alnicola]